jgi:APA family basic amino acid/polyamine antiporter
MEILGILVFFTSGTYIYGARLFSPVASFTGVWAYILGAILGLFPLFALTGATFLRAVFPSLPKLPVAFCILLFFYLSNLFGVKIVTSIQAVMVAVLLSALLLFIGKGVPQISIAFLSPLFPNGMGGFAVAVSILTFTILGSNAAVELGDEIINPRRNIPLSFLISIPIVTVLYVIIGLVAGGVAPWGTLRSQALSEVARKFLRGYSYGYFVLAGGFRAVATTLNATYLWGTKSLLVITEDGLFPHRLAGVNKRVGTPHWLLTFIFVISSLALWLIGDRVETFAVFASLGGIVVFIPVMGAVLRLRNTHPEIYARARFKLKGGFYFAAPIIGILMAVLIIVILLVDLSSHQQGLLFLILFLAWTSLGAVYGYFRLKGKKGVVLTPQGKV